MTGTTSLRKSNRLSRTAKVEGSNAQSRITEFVNVRKRASGVETTKKIEEIEVCERRESSVVLTPVKNKRKIVKRIEADVEAKITGILTPSPSLESVTTTEQEQEKVDETKDKVAETKEKVVETKEKVDETKKVENIITNSNAKVPAYKRFAHLVEGVRNQRPKLEVIEEPAAKEVNVPLCSSLIDHKFVPWLPLNEKWSIYEKIIFNVDNLCVLAAGRSQPCVFHKIQKTLENVLGKQVPLEQMERLKTLWPEAYEYRESRVVMQGKRVDSVALSVPGIGGTDSSAALLNERKEQVRSRVQKYLINAHSKLFNNDAKTLLVPNEWHSKFDQNEVAELPRTPLIENNEIIIPERSSTPKLINDIITQSTTSTDNISNISNTSDINTSNNINDNDNILSSSSKKLSLLERIREKEQKLQVQKCYPNAEAARLEAILSQMDRFTQSVMFCFSSAKKTSLFLTDLTNKLMQSAVTPLCAAEVLERLKLLEKAAPEWIKIVIDDNFSGTPKHVKILDKTRSLNSILDSLKTMKRN